MKKSTSLPQAIIFDFDGVICESVEAKTEAFRRLFRQYPRYLDRILAYHIENGGVSRYKKFEFIYRNLLRKTLTSRESQRLGKKFTKYALHQVLKSSYVNGALRFFRKFYKKIPLYVVSGTPHEEIRYIVRRKRLTKFFRDVYGSPDTKRVLIKRILNENRLKNKNVWYIGDSSSDQREARKAGVFFIGRLGQNHLSSPFRNLSSKNLISHFGDLTDLITQRH